ncbi:MAG: glutathione S-transferase family protein [Rhodospirillaceae bacterium]|jgi:glutathione S-transferase|nr:glutathione S-transferase family protein [Rhodospirillaceae bacterium]
MLKILGRRNSSNVQKVLWCCGELGVPFEREDYGGVFGKTRDDSYLAMNPNSRVPTIIDDDLVLWESNSIIRYLANKYSDGALYPSDPAARGQGERWMDWQLSILGPATQAAFWGLVRTAPEDRDMDAIMESRQNSADAMAILDRYLGQTDFVAGSEFSICDIPVGVFTFRWFNMDIEREDYPNLRRWYDRLRERPAYQEHIMNPLT